MINNPVAITSETGLQPVALPLGLNVMTYSVTGVSLTYGKVIAALGKAKSRLPKIFGSYLHERKNPAMPERNALVLLSILAELDPEQSARLRAFVEKERREFFLSMPLNWPLWRDMVTSMEAEAYAMEEARQCAAARRLVERLRAQHAKEFAALCASLPDEPVFHQYDRYTAVINIPPTLNKPKG